MSKLEIEFELTGLKFKIKGEKEDVPNAIAAMQRQLATLMQTAGSTAGMLDAPKNGSAQPPVVDVHAQQLIESPPASGGKGRGRKTGPRAKSTPIDFKHDPEKFGFPKQEWTTAQKAMWLLYVLAQEASINECAAGVIAATFNKHFKSFGSIQPPNVHRDLGKEKGKSGWINSDASKDPQTWHLLEEVKRELLR